MAPRFLDDVFTSGMGDSMERSGRDNAGIFRPVSNAAFVPPTESNTPRSKRNSNRIMAEKGVDTSELRKDTKRRSNLSPIVTPKLVDRTTNSMRLSRASIASSQASYWEGDEEFEQLINLGDLDDEQSVEDMPDTQPDSAESVTDSTASSITVDTVSTAQTSVESGSFVDTHESARRRKRAESLDEECHLPAEKPAQIMRLHKPETARDRSENGQTALISAKIATVVHETKETRSLPLLINPGRSSASTSTSVITSHGVLSSSTTSPTKATLTSSCPYFIIAHDQRVQSLLDKYRICKGVQFEVARGITQNLWKWSDITEDKVKQLGGSHQEKVGQVASIIVSRSSTQADQRISRACAELDREHSAWMENCGRGLGLMGPWGGENNWYGGRVQLKASITLKSGRNDGKPESYAISLKPFTTGKSYRLARFASSLSVLQLKFADGASRALRDGGLDLLARKFVLCGRVYCPFYAKDGKAYLVETDENYERQPISELGDKFRRPFDSYICWHNSLEQNKEQPMSKWVTRFALALSTSRPGVMFNPENIEIIPDIYAGGVKGGAETIMTDGCGFINRSALLTIARTLGQDTIRVAVQGRIAGAKGLWLQHPDVQQLDPGQPPKIWIRDSQIKVQLPSEPSEWDKSQLIFDVVRINRLSVPAGVNYQTIMNMSHNGVEDRSWDRLMAAALEKHIRPLMTWEGPFALPNLAKAVENAGGLMGSRLSRAAGSDARLYGHTKDEREDEDEDEERDNLITRDPHSGYPISLHESTRELLQAGFSPLELPLLRSKISYILTLVINSCLERFHIPIEMSAEAFIVPDPIGALNEDEIYFHCSKGINNPIITLDSCTVVGDVLLFRNPTRVASDIRKVKAVGNDKLAALGYMDVIILSTKGHRSLASYLGGGDYDGDTATVIIEPELVNAFKNSRIVDPPSDLIETNFEREIEKVSEFMDKIPPSLKDRELFKRLLLGLSDTKVGQYSNFHENAVYKLGYDDPATVRLAYMFTTCLDSSKTGYRVRKSIFGRDERQWNMKSPTCLQKGEQDLLADTSNRDVVKRPPELGKFILEKLHDKGKSLKKAAFLEYTTKCNALENSSKWKDEALFRPWDQFIKHAGGPEKGGLASLFKRDQERVKEFVHKLYEDYSTRSGNSFGSSPKKNKGSFSRTGSSETSSISVIWKEISANFDQGPSPPLECLPPYACKDIIASYAAHYSSKQSSGKLALEFPFVVAHECLCAMKAKQKGGSIACTREFAAFSMLNGNLLKSAAQSCNSVEAPANAGGTAII